jgi:hypothetical protein
MVRQTIYVTYDLPQASAEAARVPGAKKVTIEGRVVRHEVGEFRTPAGTIVPGVRLVVVNEDEEDLEKRLVQVPANAQNVQVHLDQLPAAYQGALDSAA